MSEILFQPRKARKTSHSDNPKTKRNREAEAAKSGFEAAELKARTAFRTSKSRHLAKLHRTPGWLTLTPAQREDREADVVEALEEKLAQKIRALDKLWNIIGDGSSGDEQDDDDDSPENQHHDDDDSPENQHHDDDDCPENHHDDEEDSPRIITTTRRILSRTSTMTTRILSRTSTMTTRILLRMRMRQNQRHWILTRLTRWIWK